MSWSANTAIGTTTPAPGVKWLWEHHYMDEGMKVLDYGAGRGRNASWLRSHGVSVYAYDPYHRDEENGWSGVSDALPDGPFDIVFTSYVLNVLPKDVECSVISDTRTYAPTRAHIVRGDEVVNAIAAMYRSDNPHVLQSWREFRGDVIQYELEDFCKAGVHTGVDKYQRLSQPDLTLVHSNKSWNLYIDGEIV